MPHAGEYLTGPNIEVRGRIRGLAPLQSIGYAAGAGATVTQATNKSTGVTLDTVTGRITMNAANLAAGAAVSFTWTNSAISGNDNFTWAQKAGTNGAYSLTFTPSLGSCVVTLRNLTAGALAEAFEFNFAIIRGAVS